MTGDHITGLFDVDEDDDLGIVPINVAGFLAQSSGIGLGLGSRVNQLNL
jgi:hypothetical protein